MCLFLVYHCVQIRSLHTKIDQTQFLYSCMNYFHRAVSKHYLAANVTIRGVQLHGVGHGGAQHNILLEHTWKFFYNAVVIER